MEERRKNIDDLFREGLQGYRETPPPAAWTSLEKRLPRNDRNHRKGLWLLLLLLLAGSAAFLIYKTIRDSDTSLRPSSENHRVQKESTDIENAAATSASNMPDLSSDTNTSLPESGEEPSGNLGKGIPATATSNDGVKETREGKFKTDDRERTAQPNTSGTSRSTRNGSRETTANRSSANDSKDFSVAANRSSISNASETQSTSANGRRPSGNHQSGYDNTVMTTPADAKRSGTKTSKETSTSPQNASNSEALAGPNTPLSKDNKENSSRPEENERNGATSTKAAPNNSKTASNKLSDDSYLRQPVPEEDDDDASSSNEEHERENAVATIKKGGETEGEEKRKLLYIPPESSSQKAEPSTANTIAVPNKAQVSSVNTTNKQTDENSTLTSTGTPLTVSSTPSDKKDLQVKPAEFTPKKELTVKPGKHEKSKLNVDSHIPAEPGEPIVVKEEISQTNPQLESATSFKSLLAASGTGIIQEEEKKSTPSASGGGGGGGGATSPAKNGSKFRFDIGMKAGYERGFANFSTSSFIISPYLQWNISTGFAFVFQPGVRYNQINRSDITSPTQAYHNITSQRLDSNHVITSDSSDTFIQYNYTYRNTYDSIVVGSVLKTKNYWEIELPVMLRYKIGSNLAIFGGISLIFGNMVEMEEKRSTYSGLTKSSSVSYPRQLAHLNGPVIPPLDNYFTYNTPHISTASSANINPATNPARMGLMFGFSYEFQKRITLDVLYKQTISDMKYVPNEDVRKLYTQPYLRIMIGFKLFEGGKDQTPPATNPAGL